MNIRKKRRILIISISFRPNLGGVETHLDDLCRYLTNHNHFVYVMTYQPITTKASGKRIEQSNNLEIHRIPWFGYDLFHKLEPYPLVEWLYLFPRLFFASISFMVRKHNKIDAIHAHGFIAAMVTRIITLIYPKKIVMSIHAIYNFKKRGLMARFAKLTLSGFDTIFPLAHASSIDLIAAGIAEGKVKTYRQWVDQKVFRPLNKSLCRRRLKLKNMFTVLFVGRLLPKKGVFILTQVARLMPENNFVFVGDGPALVTLRGEANKHSNIIIVGQQSQDKTAIYYGAADVVAVPSLYSEGFARVVLEALSSGRPIIAADKGCLPEMIDSMVGILVKPATHNLVRAISRLKENRQLLKAMSRNARPFAEKCYSEKNAEVIAESYR